MNFKFDQRDQDLLNQILINRDQIEGPRIGDYVLFSSGELERFSHDWGDDIQTTPEGSFFLYSSGQASFSGSLNPGTPTECLGLTEATLPGWFWFFHHGQVQAGGRVNFEAPCRVFMTNAPYQGFLGQDFQMAPNRMQVLRALLADQLSMRT